MNYNFIWCRRKISIAYLQGKIPASFVENAYKQKKRTKVALMN